VVTAKVAEVAAAATVTDAGTVRVALVLVRVIAAPPVGAALLRVTVQVELLDAFNEAGRQERELTVGSAPPVTIPPVADDATKVPAADTAKGLVMPTAVVVTPVAMVRFTTPTVPFAMIAAVDPESTQV
jgi:hypothetical protein